jgi:hypothetical protein
MADNHWSPSQRLPERQPTPGELLFGPGDNRSSLLFACCFADE